MLNLAVIIEIAGLMTIMILIHSLIRAKESFERKIMIVTCIAAFVMNAGYLSELISPTLEACLASIKMEYFGAIWVNFSLMIFVYRFCYKKFNRIALQMLSLTETVITLAVFTNDLHHTLYSHAEYVLEPYFPHVVVTYGPLFYIHLGVLMIVLGLSIKTIIGFYRHSKKTNTNLKKLWMLKYIVIAPLVPFFGMAMYSLKILKVYDIAPILTLIVSSAIIIIMLRNNIFDLTGTARSEIIQNMDDAIIVLDEFFNLQDYNDAAVALFPDIAGISAGTKISLVKSVPIDVFMHPEKTGTEMEFNGRFTECVVKVLYDGNGKVGGYLAVFVDVTSAHEDMEQMVELKKRIDAANKVKDDFLSNMSHEIRTPMNAIIGMSELILEESAGRRVYDFACDIKVASQSLLTIVDDIFDITNMESGKIELREVDYYIEPLLKEVCTNASGLADEKGLIFKRSIDEHLPYKLHGDINRIRQIFTNLLTNAVKYTNRGYVMMEVSFEPMENDRIRLILSVQDTGIGLRPVDLERIFQTFTQIDTEKNREASGMGLGLSISNKLAHAMGGEITVDSEYGKGSTFTATIVQSVVGTATIAERPKSVPEENKNLPFIAPDAKILIVDDNKINIKVVKGLLKPYKFMVDDALSGFEAIDYLKDREYDIVFMDHMMPEMDGVETTRRIRESGNDVTVIALTANTDKNAEQMFLSNGFQDVAFKPIQQTKLSEILRTWIPEGKKQYVTEEADEEEHMNEARKKTAEALSFEPRFINFSEGLAKSPLGLEDYLSILELYYEDGLGKRDYIKELSEKEDYKNYTIEVHGLKSASYNIAAMELGDMALAHENAGKDGRIDFIRENVEELLHRYDDVLHEIKRILDDYKPAEPQGKKKIAITRDELSLMVKDVLTSVENFKSKEAREKMVTLLNFDIPEDIAGKLEEAQHLLKMYDDENAETVLKNIIDSMQKGG